MSWWNPWGEARYLRKELAFQTNRANRNAERALEGDIKVAQLYREKADLSSRLEQAVYDLTAARQKLAQTGVVRDPATGRLAKAGA